MKKIFLVIIGVIFFLAFLSLAFPQKDKKPVETLQPTATPTQTNKETPPIGKTQPYKVVKKETYGDFTEESWKELVKYVKTTNKIVSESNLPIKSIKIYFKNDGITIDIERVKQTYSIKDIEPILSSLKEKLVTLVKEESIDIVIPGDISKDDIKATITSIIQEETTRDNDLDKVFIVAWRNETDMTDGFTLAYAVWEPESDITEKIARENTRDGYSVNWIRIDNEN